MIQLLKTRKTGANSQTNCENVNKKLTYNITTIVNSNTYDLRANRTANKILRSPFANKIIIRISNSQIFKFENGTFPTVTSVFSLLTTSGRHELSANLNNPYPFSCLSCWNINQFIEYQTRCSFIRKIIYKSIKNFLYSKF